MKHTFKLILISVTAGLVLTSCYTRFAMTQTRKAWDSYDVAEYQPEEYAAENAVQDTFYTDDGETYISETPIYSPEINYYYFDGSPYWDSWCYDPWFVSFRVAYYPYYYDPFYYPAWYGWYPAFPVVYYPVYIYDPFYWDYPPSYAYTPPRQPRPFGKGGTVLSRGEGSRRVALGDHNRRPGKSGVRPPAGGSSGDDGFIAVRSTGSRSGSDQLKRVTIRKTSGNGKTTVSRTSGGTSKRKYYTVKKTSGRSDSYRAPQVKKIKRTSKSGVSRSYTGRSRSSVSSGSRSSSGRSRSSVTRSSTRRSSGAYRSSSSSRSSSSRSAVSRSSSSRSSVSHSASRSSVSRSSSSRSSSSRSSSTRSVRRR